MPRFRPSRNHPQGDDGSQAGDDDFEDVYSQTNTESNFSRAETVTGDGPQRPGGDRQSRLMLGLYSPTPTRDVINLVNSLMSNMAVSSQLCGFASATVQQICDAAAQINSLRGSTSQDEMRRAQRSTLHLYETQLEALAQAIDTESPTGRQAIQPTSALIRTLTMRLPPTISTTISAALSGLLARNARLLESQQEGGFSRPGTSSGGSGPHAHRSYHAFRQPSGSFEFEFMSDSWIYDDFLYGDSMPGGRMPGGGMPGGPMFGESMFGGPMFDEDMPGGGMPGGGMPYMGSNAYGMPPYD